MGGLCHRRDDPIQDICNTHFPLALQLPSGSDSATAELFPIHQQRREGKKEAAKAAKNSRSSVLGESLKKSVLKWKEDDKTWTSN